MATPIDPTLLRWLGPWADEDTAPEVRVERVWVPAFAGAARPMWAKLYRPRGKVRRAGLVVPGLHYAGPDDPRLDRFARILAASGALVVAPHLPDFGALRVAPTLADDAARALELLFEMPERAGHPPFLFSISFGSLPALRLACHPRYRGRLSGLVVFGGYADFRSVVSFSLRRDGDAGPPHDPLNRPVVFLNLVPELRGIGALPPEEDAVPRAWRAFIERTWGREAMKAPERYRAVVEALASRLDGRERETFRAGCGLTPNFDELAREAIAASGERFDHLDPRPALAEIGTHAHVFHGADDDVIPHQEGEKLYAALPAHARGAHFVTGLYGHTRGGALPGPAAIGRELTAMLGMLRVLGDPSRR